MILSNIRRILKDDLSRMGELPNWLDSFLTPINQFIDTVGQALRNNLTFKDNFSCKEVSLSFTHGVSQKVSTGSSTKVKGILIIDTGGLLLDSSGFSRNTDQSINVTLNFSGGTSSTKANCVLEVLLG